jgi:hypothetical protein
VKEEKIMSKVGGVIYVTIFLLVLASALLACSAFILP